MWHAAMAEQSVAGCDVACALVDSNEDVRGLTRGLAVQHELLAPAWADDHLLPDLEVWHRKDHIPVS